MDKNKVMAVMNLSMTDNFGIDSGSMTAGGQSNNLVAGFMQTLPYHEPLTGWSYWRDYYYPTIIRESYPVYIQEKAVDKGKQAFEILKTLQDKKLIKLEKVADFIEAMDSLIKIL